MLLQVIKTRKIIPQSTRSIIQQATVASQENPAKSAAKSNAWTNNKGDTSGKYLENLKYRRTTSSNKWKSLNESADIFASQTGVQVKIIIFNTNNNKKEAFYTKNMKVEPNEHGLVKNQETSRLLTSRLVKVST